MQYVVVLTKTGNGWGAYVPDLPGCVALDDTFEETKELIREAVGYHLELMIEDGDQVPEYPMSMDEAIAYHDQLIAEIEEDGWPDDSPTSDANPSRFELVEVEISPALAATA